MIEFLQSSSFGKSLKRLDVPIQKAVLEKLKFLSEQENPLVFAKRLKGYKNLYRFRSGDYRIVFEIEKRGWVLLLVKHRKEVYDDL